MKSLKTTKGLTLIQIESLRVLISLSGMSQRELAAACGMKESQVSEYLSGAVAIGPVALVKFAMGLKVSPEVLARAEGISLEEVRRQVIDQLAAKSKAGTNDFLAAPAKIDAPSAVEQVQPDTSGADRVSMLDRKLLRHLVRSVEQSDENTEAVIVYKVAASRPDDDTPREPEPAFIPREIRKLLGKGGIALRIVGESMLDAGIEPGDIVFAKRVAHRPADRSIVVALLHGATTCKRLVGNELIAESPVHEDHAPIEDDAIIGVVQAIYKPDRSNT